MSSPYQPPISSSAPPTPPRRGWILALVALAYGGCGSTVSLPWVAMTTNGDTCLFQWHDQLLCRFELAWPVAMLVCFAVPTITHVALMPRLVGSRTSWRAVGAASVVASVVVTFGTWRLLLDVPLLWAGPRYLLVMFLCVVAMGIFISPVGWLLGGWLAPDDTDSQVQHAGLESSQW